LFLLPGDVVAAAVHEESGHCGGGDDGAAAPLQRRLSISCNHMPMVSPVNPDGINIKTTLSNQSAGVELAANGLGM